MDSAYQYFVRVRIPIDTGSGGISLWRCNVCFSLVDYVDVPDHFSYHRIT